MHSPILIVQCVSSGVLSACGHISVVSASAGVLSARGHISEVSVSAGVLSARGHISVRIIIVLLLFV